MNKSSRHLPLVHAATDCFNDSLFTQLNQRWEPLCDRFALSMRRSVGVVDQHDLNVICLQSFQTLFDRPQDVVARPSIDGVVLGKVVW